MFPKKLIRKKAMIASNHQALYIRIRAVSVLYLSSINVPMAIAAANTINSTAMSRVENRKEKIFLSIFKEGFDKPHKGTLYFILSQLKSDIECYKFLKISNKQGLGVL